MFKVLVLLLCFDESETDTQGLGILINSKMSASSIVSPSLTNGEVVHSVSKPTGSIHPITVRLCPKCFALSHKKNSKTMKRSCSKCKATLCIICPGCETRLSIRSSYQHFSLCKTYHTLCNSMSLTQFGVKYHRILKEYIRQHRPGLAKKQTRFKT